MKKNPKQLFILIIALALSACGPRQPASLPTFDVNNVIIQTAVAAQTQTAISMPTATATIIPTVTPTAPTSTPTNFFDILNETPSIPVETLDQSLNVEDGLPGFLPTKAPSSYDFKYSDEPWSCVGAGRYPSGEILRAGKPFIATWIAINNGQRDWTQNIIDFVYKSGYRHESYRIQDLDRYVASGRNITLYVDFIAPKAPGFYRAVWELRVGSRGFCGVQFEFEIAEN